MERKCLKENGYIKTKKVCDTLQGELFEAKTLDGTQTVMIKKTDKTLHNKRISIQQGMSIVVEENIIIYIPVKSLILVNINIGFDSQLRNLTVSVSEHEQSEASERSERVTGFLEY